MRINGPTCLRVLLAAITAVGLCISSGCTGIYKAYPGPDRSGDEVAVLLMSGDLLLAKIDGKIPMHNEARVVGTKSLILLPGRHSIALGCGTAYHHSTQNKTISANFLAGQMYRVKANVEYMKNYPVNWNPRIEDLGPHDPAKYRWTETRPHFLR